MTIRTYISVLVFLIVTVTTCNGEAADKKKCVYIDSYHLGDTWADGVLKGFMDKIGTACEVEVIHLDAKKNKSAEHLVKKSIEAKALIEKVKPDVVIVADDPACEGVLTKYYKDSPIPFVFVGINWSIKEYGMPFHNTTGMLEIAPVKGMIFEARKALGTLQTVALIDADNPNERKDVKYTVPILESENAKVKTYFVNSVEEWRKAYVEAQESDFVYILSTTGIPNFDMKENYEFARKNLKKLSGTTSMIQVSLAAFGVGKIPAEQGEFGAEATLKILGGASPKSIPITGNKSYESFLNPGLLEASKKTLSPRFTEGAKVVHVQ